MKNAKFSNINLAPLEQEIISDTTRDLLKQSRQKAERAMKEGNIMLWMFDVQKQLFYSDNESLNNYDQSIPITIQQYIEIVHPDNRATVSQIMDRMSSGENFSFNIETLILLPSNHEEWQYCAINGSPYEIQANGNVAKYMGTRKNNNEQYKKKLLLDKILNSIPLSIHIKDIEDNFRYVFCNNESKSLFGTSEDKTAYDIMPTEGVERIQRTDLEVYQTGIPYQGLENITLKNGRSYDAIVRKSIIEDNGKRLILSTRWDQSMQNELTRRSKLLAASMETMQAYTWIYEPSKKRISFGEGFNKVCNRVTEISTLEQFMPCLHPDDLENYIHSLKEVIAKDSDIWSVECRLDFNGNGNYTWWEIRGILDTAIINDIPNKYLYGMSICIEPHKQIETTLRENEKKLNHLIHQNELILNNTNSGLAYITPDYIVQWENISRSSASISYEAYKQGEYCYKSTHNRTEPCENCVLERAMISRQLEQIQFTLANNRTVEIFATPVFNKDQTLSGIVIRVDDTTEREKMIEELKQIKARAEQSDKLKSAFLANMSHEIRTPLNAIVGFSDLLMQNPSEEEREEYMNIINTNNELLLKLISDILDLSKIEANSLEFIYDQFDLSEYFNNLAGSMNLRITNPNIRFITINPYNTCHVKLDKNRVAQLMINYLTNAIKYTPKGFIEMGYECTEKGVRFYVKDSGIGISDNKKNHVFQRFAKLDEFAQGTGLGLSICKAIAETMGGSVGFESQDGVGSTFWAFLPCKPEIDATPNALKSLIAEKDIPNNISSTLQESDQLSGIKLKTILVAEDIYSNFLLIATLLRKQYNVLHAQNGEQAIQMVQENEINLLLMDMKMPIINGLTATAEIRKFNQKLPIIALTAHAFESDQIAARSVGCNEYLVKPIDKEKLMSIIHKYCQ